jgi:hypothetical protein
MIIPLTPLEQKRTKIGQIFVQHPAVVGVRRFLDDVHGTGFRVREMETAYIMGWSRCGKSETIKRWIHQLTGQHVVPGVGLQVLEGNGNCIVFADMTIGATPMQASQMIGNRLFGSSKILTLKELPVTDEFIRILIANGVTILVIDESQMLLLRGGADKFAAWILSIENARAFQLVLVGSPLLERLHRTVDATDARQAGSRVIKPFAFATRDQRAQYGAFVKSFSAESPFKRNWISEALKTDKRFDTLRCLYFADRGKSGVHAKLHEFATVEACRDTGDSDELTKEHFRLAFDLRFLDNHKYLGCNPFNDSDYDRLPQFPLVPDGAELEMKDYLKLRSPHRKGGRIYGDSW